MGLAGVGGGGGTDCGAGSVGSWQLGGDIIMKKGVGSVAWFSINSTLFAWAREMN